MDSQNIIFVTGRLAATPELETITNTAEPFSKIRFRLLCNQYAGQDNGGNPRQRTTNIDFTAYNRHAERIARLAAKGDQLIIRAEFRNNNYTKDGVDHYTMEHRVVDIEFGAQGRITRERLASQAAQEGNDN